MSEGIVLSILIATLDERAGLLCRLLDNITKQIEENNAKDKVEIICELDNRVFTTGYKRNILLNRATGKYLVFIDDDDSVPNYYIKELLIAAESDCDCFAINGVMTTNGQDSKRWFISIHNQYITVQDGYGSEYFMRYPNHICPIRSSIAKQFKFPDVTQGEDFAWATAIHNTGILKNEYVISLPMYTYNFKYPK